MLSIHWATDAGFLCVFDVFFVFLKERFHFKACGVVWYYEFTHASTMFSLVKVVESSQRI